MKRLFLFLSVFAVMAYGQTITVTGTPLTSFGNVAINTNSSEQSFSISAAGLTEFDEFILNAPAGFEISTTSGSGFTTTLNVGSADQLGDIASTTIYVRFSPTSTGSASGNITVAAGAATTQNVAVTGSGIETEPTTAASSITFTPVRATTLKINWTNGNGANRIVVVRASSAVDFTPSDATAYTANTNFALGTAVGTACKVVYNGTGSSTVVTHLSASTTYHISIFEYNGSSTTANYASGATGSQATTAATALTGPTYTVGTDGDFPTLAGAVNELNTSGVGDSLTFEIVSDITEPANFGLGVNTAGYAVKFRPSADVNRTITFTQSTDNSASSGGWVIGLSNVGSWASLVTTNKITIDGYASGGSTRRLTFVTASTANAAATPFHVIGDVNNLIIKNCSLTVSQTTGSSAFGAVSFRVGAWSSVDYLMDNVLIENCVINSSTPSGSGLFMSNTTSNGGAVPTGRPTGIEFRGNTITVKHRAVSLNYGGTVSVNKNEISVNQTGSGFASFGVGGANTGMVSTTVHSNKFIQLATGNTGGAANGIRAIQASGGGTWNIYNNFITGFSTPATGTTEILGIRAGSASNIYHNTIVLNNVTTTGGGTQPTSAIVLFTTSVDMRNNIIISNEDDFVNYAVYVSGANIPSTSNYNNIYRSGTVNAKIGFAASAARATLADWQSATSKDANSKSVAVTFGSSLFLHNDYKTTPDYNLVGTPIGSVTTDIEGQTRHSLYPYVGADEIQEILLPVELTSFTAVANGKNVELKWSTATEVNNHGFDVERMTNGAWSRIGFVQGAGNSNAPKEYSYRDAGLPNGTVLYRLKQIDADGKFTYNNAIEVVVNTAVTRYELSQNYPNPFNPTTTIRFALPAAEQATVKVYDMAGREVAELFNQVAAAGQVYNVQFSGAGLASGIYLYVLQTQSYREVRKMSLLK